MHNEYLPRGPSESVRIRLYAEDNLSRLKASPALGDKAKFMNWLDNLNKEILGVPQKHKATGQADGSSIQNTNSSTPNTRTQTHVSLGDDIKIPSYKSLQKLQQFRDSLCQSAGLPVPERPPEQQREVRVRADFDHDKYHDYDGGGLPARHRPPRPPAQVGWDSADGTGVVAGSSAGAPIFYQSSSAASAPASARVSPQHQRGPVPAAELSEDPHSSRGPHTQLGSLLKALYLECYWLHKESAVADEVEAEAEGLAAHVLNRELLSRQTEMMTALGSGAFEGICTLLMRLGEGGARLSLADFLDLTSAVVAKTHRGGDVPGFAQYFQALAYRSWSPPSRWGGTDGSKAAHMGAGRREAVGRSSSRVGSDSWAGREQGSGGYAASRETTVKVKEKEKESAKQDQELLENKDDNDALSELESGSESGTESDSSSEEEDKDKDKEAGLEDESASALRAQQRASSAASQSAVAVAAAAEFHEEVAEVYHAPPRPTNSTALAQRSNGPPAAPIVVQHFYSNPAVAAGTPGAASPLRQRGRDGGVRIRLNSRNQIIEELDDALELVSANAPDSYAGNVGRSGGGWDWDAPPVESRAWSPSRREQRSAAAESVRRSLDLSALSLEMAREIVGHY